MSPLGKLAHNIFMTLILIIIVWGGYKYRNEIATAAGIIKNNVFRVAPCTMPISYSIGTFDDRFGLSKAEFIGEIDHAGDIWGKARNTDLFNYTDKGKSDLTINLIYDYRQKNTGEMNTLGVTIKKDKATYDALKAKYNSLTANYTSGSVALKAKIQTYQTHKQSYEQKVDYWNSRGGAPRDTYKELETERSSLNGEVASIAADQKSLNTIVSDINSTVNVLNTLSRELNLHVTTFNTIGKTTGPEFDEGEYVSDQNGRNINIYQFETRAKLTRVLEHELGHALGLDHVEDSKAVMYRLNQGTSENLTAADISELTRICGEKKPVESSQNN